MIDFFLTASDVHCIISVYGQLPLHLSNPEGGKSDSQSMSGANAPGHLVAPAGYID